MGRVNVAAMRVTCEDESVRPRGCDGSGPGPAGVTS